jgi:transcriptional regulator with XRE-family HTH domain
MASQVSNRIGANLRAARKSAGLTQRQLAERIGTDSFQVSRWERGANRPQDDTLTALAYALDVDLAVFYAEPTDVAA